ncbi:winged helix-turn-helix transcriptional regulator [Methanocella paludicola]|nr:winged helix-turn-helix transcriptional regulator [Methanocella paludicola]
MRLRYKQYIFIILVSLIALSFGAVPSYAADGAIDYDVTFTAVDPNSIAPVDDHPESTSRSDILAAFWELPLHVQLSYLVITAVAILGLFKLLTFVSGRLKHALENPKTKEIFFHIQNNPGLTIQQLSDEQNINRGTLKYHLSQLFTNNKIMLVRRGKVSQLYYNKLSPMDKESIIASYMRRNDKSRPILFSIMDNPGMTNKDLSEKFGLDKSTITDYMKKFMDDDIVEFRQDGKFKRCYVKQDARMILLRLKPN